MTNPFPISDEDLKTLLDNFSSWSDNNEQEKGYAQKEMEKSKQLKKVLLNNDYMASISDDALVKDILSYSKTIEGPAKIHIGIPRVTAEIKNLRRNLNYLLDSDDDPFSKAENILDGEYKISIFAKAFWTPLFQAQYPNLLPNWNNKTEQFFNKVGIIPKKSKLSDKEKYKKISEAFLYLQKIDPKQDFFTLNHLMHYGVAIEEGIDLIDEIMGPSNNGQIQYWQIAPGDKARLWPIMSKEGYIAVGWDGTPDLSNVETEEQLFSILKKAGQGETKQKTQTHQLWNFLKNAKIGDMIIVNRGKSKIVGVGKITGEYFFDGEKSEYKHCKKVNWEWMGEKEIPKQNKFGKTIVELSKKEFEELTDILPPSSYWKEPVTEGPLTIEWLQTQTLLDKTELEEIIDAIKNSSPQIIFAGPPGTSKTWIAERIARYIAQDEPYATTFVQFHPSYGYEAFIEGLRPIVKEGGGISFERENGLVLSVVQKMKDKNHLQEDSPLYVVIIDEMNRANLPRVFGELMYLFEYRDRPIHLQYSKGFSLPPNLRFIGTMNTADRSIRSIDLALRRRFDVFEFAPNPKILEAYFKKNTNKVLDLINGFIKLNGDLTSKLDAHHTIGHTFFMKDGLDRHMLNNIWKRKIKPLINEYFFDQPDKADEFKFEKYWPGETA